MARKLNEEPEQPEKNASKQQKNSSLWKDERLRIILGITTLIMAVFTFIALFSYLFTWKSDQSKLDLDFYSFITDSAITVENWLGKTGALLAHRLIYKWFGLGSFALVLIMVVLGLRFLRYRVMPLRLTIKQSLVWMIWVSVFLGYIFGGHGFPFGGGHGYFMADWLNALLGKTGTFFFLLLFIFIFMTFSYEWFIPFVKTSFRFIKAKWKSFRVWLRNATLKPSENIEQQSLVAEDEITADSGNETVLVENEDKTMINGNDPINEEPDLQNHENHEPDFEIVVKTDDEVIENDPSEEIANGEDKNAAPVSESENAEDNTMFEVVKIENEEISDENYTIEALGEYDPTLDLSGYKLPSPDLLERYDNSVSSVTNEELITNKNKIVETLGNYKILINSIKATIGPTVTLYEIVPAPGIKISKIRSLEDDIALSLSALGIRIIAPIPGKGTIGIEVPNQVPEVVSMRSVIVSKKFQEMKAELPVVLGKTISNEIYTFDLTRMPHLLVAGATGQGKSVGLNAILTSLLYKKHPSQLKLVMIDPKKVELTLYSKIEKHFLAKLPDAEESIITDTQKVIYTLNSLCIEMDQRYELLKKAHTRNIKEYNAKFIQRKLNPNNGHKYMPYIVLVIDEFADLIMTAGKEIELPLARLAQLARAIGIHLVIATQRPTTNIITGLIKANFPARIAFRVTSSIDSRTILDAVGANQLIGRGDMLVSNGSEMVRVQCAFIDTPEIERITEAISSQQAYPTAFYLPEYVDENAQDIADIDLSKKDSLFEEAARLVVIHQQGSTSLIQRKFSIGYNRAGRIMDQLEAAGIVGPSEGSKARQVMITDEYSLEQMLNRINN